MPYTQRQKLFEDMGVHGVRRYWKSGFAKELGDDLINLFVERAASRPSPLSALLFFNMHGAASRVDPGATAFGLCAVQWDFDVISQWIDPTEDERQVQWTREFWSEAEPFANAGVYVNHIAADEPERLHVAFGDNYARLVSVKTQYDPSNVFRLNHNIRPKT
jgi:FAD/FMN-containing dehydrogenase